MYDIANLFFFFYIFFLGGSGGAKNNRVVFVALYPVMKESFQIYYEIVELMAIFVDRFMELDIPENVKVYEIFSRIAKQFEELDSFYAWSKDIGITRPSDYPEIGKITQKRLDVMDELIRDKTALAQGKKEQKKSKEATDNESTSDQPKDNPEAKEEDVDASKALAQTEDVVASDNMEEKPDKEEEPEKEDKEEIVHHEADLLNLGRKRKCLVGTWDGSYPSRGVNENKEREAHLRNFWLVFFHSEQRNVLKLFKKNINKIIEQSLLNSIK